MRNTTTAPLAHRVPDACNRIGVGKSTLYELIQAGEIKPLKIGSRTLIPESELQKLLAKRMEAAA